VDKLKEKCGLHYLNCGLEVDINKKGTVLNSKINKKKVSLRS